MAGITIYDAFKALDDISDDVVKDEVKKVSQKQPKKLKESVETINISGNDMYDKGQAYYYARTGDHVDYDGKRYEIIMDKDGKHKIGYSDTILLKGDDGETIEVSKKDFIDGATLLKEEVVNESQDDYWVLSDGKNPKNSQVFTEIKDVDEFIKELDTNKCDDYCELLHYVKGSPKKVWDSKDGRVQESCELKEEPKYDMAPEFDSRKSFYGKAKVDVRPDGTQILYSYGTPVCKITKDGDVTLLRKGYLGWASSQTTLRHVKEFLKQNGKEAGSINDLRKRYPVEQFNESINEGMVVDINDKEEVDEGKEFLESEEDGHVEQVVDVDAETIEELKDSYLGNVILRCPSCKTLIYKKPELLEKDNEASDDENAVYNVGETCPHCGSKDGFELVGQVASLEVKGQEDAPTTGKDEIEVTDTTVEDEQKDESEQEESEEEKKINKTTVIEKESLNREILIDSLDEETFDKVVNRYLEATYNNVENYKTTNCSIDGNNAIIEGIIKFKSGKEKQTSFNLNGVAGKNDKIRFVGMNEMFSKSKKAFNFICKNDKGNLISESLTYRYNAGDSKKVRGKIVLK